MTVYCYDPETFIFTGIEDADPDPLDPGNFLIPANSTIEQPPGDWAGKIGMSPFWIGGRWIIAKEDPTDMARVMRAARNQALMSSDWAMMRDSPLSWRDRWKWRQYRRALRNITNDPAWPYVLLPTKPK